MTITRQKFFFQRTGIDADTDRHTAGFGFFHHSSDIGLAADIARIDPQSLDAIIHGQKRQTMVEVDICYDRHWALLADDTQGFCCFLIQDCHPDDLTACLGKLVDLG